MLLDTKVKKNVDESIVDKKENKLAEWTLSRFTKTLFHKPLVQIGS